MTEATGIAFASRRAEDIRLVAGVSGAHFVSTDYLVADERFSAYAVSLPGGVLARCNPVIAPPTCEDDQLSE